MDGEINRMFIEECIILNLPDVLKDTLRIVHAFEMHQVSCTICFMSSIAPHVLTLPIIG